MVFCCRSLENTANCVVLFLQFSRNRKCYSRLCGKLHVALGLCFVYKAQKKLDCRNRRDEQYKRMEDHLDLQVNNGEEADDEEIHMEISLKSIHH